MFDAYSVAVKLSLVNHITPGLTTIIGHFIKANAEAGKTQTRLNDIGKQIKTIKGLTVAGGAMFSVGFAGLMSLKGPYEEAKRLEQAKADFSTLNLSASENAEAFAKAASISQKTLGTNITDNVKAIHDLHTAFGDLHHALATSEDFTKYAFAAKVKNGGQEVDGLIYNSVKALEHRGGKVINDPETFRDELTRQSQVYFGSKGKVSGADFFHASQTGKMAYSLYDKEYLYGPFAAFMQAKSGPTAGTGAMTAFSSLVGGHMDNKAKGFLASLGLLEMHVGAHAKQMRAQLEAQIGSDPEMKKALSKMHVLAPITAGMSDTNSELFARRPDKFINDVLVPAIRTKYGLDMSDEQMALLVAKNFNRSTGDFIGEHIINRSKFQKDANIFARSKGFGDAYQTYLKSPQGAETAATAAWKNLSTLIGSVYLPVITAGLTKLAGVLNWFAQKATEHPKLFKVIVGGFAALAAALAAAGIVTLVAAGVAALSAAFGVAAPVIAGVGAAVVAVTTGVGLLAGALWAFWDKIKGIGAKASGWIGDHLAFGPKINPKFASDAPPKWKWDGPTVAPAPPKSKWGGPAIAPALPKWKWDGPAVAPAPAPRTTMQATPVTINLDGRKVGEAVIPHIAKTMSRQPTGPRAVDPTSGLFPVSASLGY